MRPRNESRHDENRCQSSKDDPTGHSLSRRGSTGWWWVYNFLQGRRCRRWAGCDLGGKAIALAWHGPKEARIVGVIL